MWFDGTHEQASPSEEVAATKAERVRVASVTIRWGRRMF